MEITKSIIRGRLIGELTRGFVLIGILVSPLVLLGMSWLLCFEAPQSI